MDFDSNRRIGYFYNEDIGKFSYGSKHIMDPKRISMAHSLIVGYNLYKDLDVYETREASKQEITQFHSQDYIDYLEYYVSPDKNKILKQLGYAIPQINEEQKNDIDNKTKFGIDVQQDCPGFDGLYTFCQLSTGGSIDCAHLLVNGQSDIAINWGGGLHHAKKGEAYGFCYTNDIVVCILELLKHYVRVLYIDIDVHHGDGVEEAFFATNRVMTVSFHEYGNNFFPGTGSLNSIGESMGLYHSINVPLKPGMDDNTFRELFKTVIHGVIEKFRPDAIVLQSGADSIAYDRIGHFNMSIKGHGECVKLLMKYGIPLVVLGGGGYTINNVSRCWAYETGLITGKEITGKIPEDDQFYYMYTQYTQLHFPVMQNCENQNTSSDLNKITSTILSYLKEIEGRPGYQIHDVPQACLYSDIVDPFEEERMLDEAWSKGAIDGEEERRLKEKMQTEKSDYNENDISERGKGYKEGSLQGRLISKRDRKYF